MTTPALAFRHRIPLHYYLRFQGLPGVCFGDGPDPGLAGVTYSPSLRVRDQQTSAELKTGSAIGSGRALDIVLDADTLAASGVYSTHFTEPEKITSVLGALPMAATTIPTADGTDNFAASGSFFWGHEKIAYGSKSSTSFLSCTRGAGVTSTGINYATASPDGVSGIWNLITDKPTLWRGRLVELWAVASAPEGDLLGAPFTVSNAAFRVWIGHVDGQPAIIPTGIQIRALPAERSIDREYGWGQTWKTTDAPARWWDRLIYWPSGGKFTLYWQEDEAGGGSEAFQTVAVEPLSGKAADDPERILTVLDLWEKAATLWLSDSVTDVCNVSVIDSSESLALELKTSLVGGGILEAGISTGGSAGGMHHAIGAIQPGKHYNEAPGGPWNVPAIFTIKSFDPFPSPQVVGGFLINQPEEGSDQIYAGVPIAGQRVTWKQGDRQLVAGVIRVIPMSSQWASSGYFVVTGSILFGGVSPNTSHVGEVSECVHISGQQTLGAVWLQLLETSGGALLASATPGSFGSSDLLPIGWGARIPADWIAGTFASGNAEKAPSPFVAYDLDADSLFIDAIALKIGITQKFTSGAAVIDSGALFAPQEADTETTITTASLLAEPIRIGPREKPPNVVEVEFFSPDKPKLTIRNQLRIQAEGGIKKASFKVPDHWEDERLTALVQSVSTPDQLLSNVYIYDLSVGPETAWSLNPGDRLGVTGRHYAWVDFSAGSHRGSSVSGRVLGITRKLDGSGGSVRLAVWGSKKPDYYCPDSEISNVNLGTNTITLPTGRAGWFWDGDRDDLLFYRPGSEDSKLAENEMQSSAGDTITLDGLPAWLTTADRVTFATYASAEARMREWAYTDDGGALP